MKIAIKILLLTGVLGYLIFAITTMSQGKDSRICSGIKIIIEDSTTENYIDSRYIENIIAKEQCPIKDIPIGDINANDIENLILASPYVDSVICYYTPENLMCIRVFTRIPVLHVINNSGDSYYMDMNGNDMPTNEFLMDICLATGNITKQYAKENLLAIADYINTHSPWNNEIQQIYVRTPKHVELIPSAGEHIIILGEPTDIKNKMEKLAIFQKEGLDKAGWNKYKTINLNYSGQVVCTKRNKN